MPGLPLLLAALGIVGLGFGLLAFVVVVLSSSFDAGADVIWIGGNLVIGCVGLAVDTFGYYLLQAAGASHQTAGKKHSRHGQGQRSQG